MSPVLKRRSAKTVTRRGHSKPPQELELYIKLVNLERLFERDLPDPRDPVPAMYDALRKGAPISARKFLDWEMKGVRNTVARLAPETRKFLGPPKDLMQFYERWERLKSAGQALCAIAEWPRGKTGELLVLDRRFGVRFPPRVSVGIAINERGQGERLPNRLLDALEGAQLDHIRACAICRRIFWAPRFNSECCGRQCRKTYNQRKSRANRKAGNSGKVESD
jgi:hypothetical protein